MKCYRTKTIKLVLLSIGACIVMMAADSQSVDQRPYAQLLSGDAKERIAAFQEIQSQQRQTIQLILDAASKEPQPAAGVKLNTTKELSIKLLGELKSEQAVPFLIKEISFQVPTLMDSPR